MFKKVFFSIIFLLVTAACTSVEIKKPATRLMTSEVSGRLMGGRAGAQLLGTANVKIIKEPTGSAPSTNPNIDESQDFGVQLHLGMMSRLDVYLETSMLGPNATGLKLQLLGDGRATAGAGNTSLSVFGAPLWGSWKQEDAKNSGQANEVKAKSEISVSGYEAGVSLGHRVYEEILLYLSVHRSEFAGKAHLDQTNSGVVTEDMVRVEGEGVVQAAALGVVLGKGLFLQGEAAYVIGDWKRTTAPSLDAESLGNFMFGLNAGLEW